MQGLKEKTAKGLFWGGISNGIQQLLGLVFGIYLARLLSPDDYGVIGMFMIFTAIGSSLQEGGFAAALTNRIHIKHEDYNAVFWFNIVIGCTLYLILFFCAPFIANFFERPELVGVARIIFLSILFGCFGTAHAAYMFKNLMVKERAQIELISLTISSIVSLILALNGFGYWGLAIQRTLNMVLATALRWFYSGWRPTWSFKWQPLKEMMPFGSKLMLTTIFTQISTYIPIPLLGKIFSGTEAGYFSQGEKWMNIGKSVTSGMITGVTQPVFAQVATEQERKAQVLRKLVRFIAFLSFPCMFGLALISYEFILVTIKEQWLPSVPILQLLCIWGAFYPIADIYRNLVVSSGKSGIYLSTTVLFTLVQFTLLYFAIPYRLIGICIVYVFTYLIYLMVWQLLCTRIIPIKWWQLPKDIAPYLLITFLVMGVTYYLSGFIDNIYLRLLFKIVFAAFLYILIVWKSKSVIFRESVQFLKKWKGSHK